jgi:hypothetical protein
MVRVEEEGEGYPEVEVSLSVGDVILLILIL